MLFRSNLRSTFLLLSPISNFLRDGATITRKVKTLVQKENFHLSTVDRVVRHSKLVIEQKEVPARLAGSLSEVAVLDAPE